MLVDEFFVDGVFCRHENIIPINFAILQGMKKIVVTFVIILVALTVVLVRGWDSDVYPPGNIIVDLSEVNFAKLGYYTENDSFLYEEQEASALSVQFRFDDKSVCTLDGKSDFCLSLGRGLEGAFSGQRVLVEGIRNGDVVLVRNLEKEIR